MGDLESLLAPSGHRAVCFSVAGGSESFDLFWSDKSKSFALDFRAHFLQVGAGMLDSMTGSSPVTVRNLEKSCPGARYRNFSSDTRSLPASIKLGVCETPPLGWLGFLLDSRD